MAVLGAILGDIAGSWLEENRENNFDWENHPLFDDNCQFTDDTVMTLAIKKAIKDNLNMVDTMQAIGRNYPFCGYGHTFYYWVHCKDPKPYNSFGNGSAMRVSYIGEHFEKDIDVRKWARASALVSHNHPEGVKGAVVTAMCVWMAKNGKTKEEILAYASEQYPKEKYKFHPGMSLEEYRKEYHRDITCQTSVPAAIRCFYESDSYISFLRNVFSLDCDTDTIGAIGGGIAEEFYKGTGLDNNAIIDKYLTDELKEILYA